MRYKRDGDMHWVMVMNGEDGYHFGKAKKHYDEAKRMNLKISRLDSKIVINFVEIEIKIIFIRKGLSLK